MNANSSRFINSVGAPREIPQLLQSIFTGELLTPSDNLWLVSPWISDIPVIDNRANTFSSFEPSWQRNQVRLAQILSRLILAGTTLHVATRPDRINQQFLRNLTELAPAEWVEGHVHQVDELHEKGLLGKDYYLGGSMNFTYNGITINEEAVHFHTNPVIVAEQRIKFLGRWGGET